MNGRTALIAIVALGLGFAAGVFFQRPLAIDTSGPSSEDACDAQAALDELLIYRGSGATASRRVIALIGQIGQGGEEVLPALETAIKSGTNYKYSTSGYSLDSRRGEVSVHPDRRNALIEAVHRIGGDEGVRILIDAATSSGTWINRVTALAYLGQRAERPDVRKFFMDTLKKNVVTHRSDAEAIQFMDTVRGRLDPEALPLLKAGLAGGWGSPELGDLMARAMAELDREETARTLVQILADTEKPVPARATAARALAQMPEHRPVTVKLVLDSGRIGIIDAFMRGLRFGRLDFVERSGTASASADPQVRLAYNRERLKDLEEAFNYLGEIRANLSDEQAKLAKLPEYLDQFSKSISNARQAARQMEGNRK